MRLISIYMPLYMPLYIPFYTAKFFIQLIAEEKEPKKRNHHKYLVTLKI